MSANSDVKLIHGAVVIDAWDLQLDSPDRRKNNTEHRRALVHDPSDGLTVNWGNDYPGGVKINAVRLITKDPNFIQPVTVSGGLHVNEGALHISKGNKVILSNADSADFTSGEIYEDSDGLHLSGGKYNQGKDEKLVNVHNPIATKVVTWGNWSNETVNRVGNRARMSSSGPQRTTRATLLAGSDYARVTPGNVVPLAGSMNFEFDIVDTFIKVLEELTELRERVAKLETAVNP